MDFQLERFEASLAGRTLHRGQRAYDREPGDTRLACGGCGATVGRNIPLSGIRNIVFECGACGARSTVARSTLLAAMPTPSPRPSL